MAAVARSFGDRRDHPAVPWRAKCYECGQEAPITVPVFETLASFADDLGHATATYEAHPRRPSDTRSCSAVVGKSVPR